MTAEKIMRAALRSGIWVASLPRPARHHDVKQSVLSSEGTLNPDTDHSAWVHQAEEGFVTSTGRFVDRQEAVTVARAAGQIPPAAFPKRCEPQDELFSEDVW